MIKATIRVKTICNHLNLPSAHFVHFGRSVGAASAEMNEVSGPDIDDLGNWNMNTKKNIDLVIFQWKP